MLKSPVSSWHGSTPKLICMCKLSTIFACVFMHAQALVECVPACTQLLQGLTCTVSIISMRVMMERDMGVMTDESASLRKALIAKLGPAAKDTPENVESAMQMLADSAPQELELMLQQHMLLSKDVVQQLLARELQLLKEEVQDVKLRVDMVEGNVGTMQVDMAEIKDGIAAVKSEVQDLKKKREANLTTTLSMPSYMIELWENTWDWYAETSVPRKALISKILAWFKDAGSE